MNRKLLTVLAVLLMPGALALLAGCDLLDMEAKEVTYISSADGETYMLTITEGAGRVAYTPKKDDRFVLGIETANEVKTSSGTVFAVSGNDSSRGLTLQPSVANAPTFNVTIINGKMTSITGTITLTGTGGGTKEGPGAVTPSNGTGSDTPSNGTGSDTPSNGTGSDTPSTGVEPGMVLIRAGTFTMGSPDDEPDRYDYAEKQHTVTLTRNFYMGRTEVTQKEWYEVMGRTIRQQKELSDLTTLFPAPIDLSIVGEGDNYPIYYVSWMEAVEYCIERSRKEGLTPVYTISEPDKDNIRWVTWNKTANGYRLPTEAEWEYACRAGTTTPFSTGDNITTDQANYDGRGPYNSNPPGVFRARTTVVGSFPPNAWGLYDMHGNLWEWCWDWYKHDITMETYDPAISDVEGTQGVKVLRGGTWDLAASTLRSALRGTGDTTGRLYYYGFRVARWE